MEEPAAQRRRFAPSLVPFATRPSTRLLIVMFLLASNAVVGALLVIVTMADMLFGLLPAIEPLWVKIIRLGVLTAWAGVNWYVVYQLNLRRRRGMRAGIPLFLLLLVQAVLVQPRNAIEILVALISLAAIVSVRDELTSA